MKPTERRTRGMPLDIAGRHRDMDRGNGISDPFDVSHPITNTDAVNTTGSMPQSWTVRRPALQTDWQMTDVP